MMYIFLSITNSIIFFGFVLLFIGLTVYQIFFKGRKKPAASKPNQNELLSNLITNLGGKQNILLVEVEGNRTKITVQDLNLCSLDKIKSQGVKNLFITGNTIKMICPFDTSSLKTIKGE